MTSLLDPNFKYVCSNATNIRDTFDRIRAELAAQAKSKPVSKMQDFAGKDRKKLIASVK